MPPFARLLAPTGAIAFAGFRSACVSGRGTPSSANAGSARATAAMTTSERANQRTRIRGAPLEGEVRATPALPTVTPTHACLHRELGPHERRPGRYRALSSGSIAPRSAIAAVVVRPRVATHTMPIAIVSPIAEPTNSSEG